MKKFILGIALMSVIHSFAQIKMIDSGYLELVGGSKILFYKLDSSLTTYHFYTKDETGKWIQNKLQTSIVSQILPFNYEISSNTLNPLGLDTLSVSSQDTSAFIAKPTKPKYASFNTNIGLALGNLLEFNNPSGTGDKVSFSLNGSLDIMYRYTNPNSVFNTSHELHWTIGVQKESLSTGSDLQRAQDDLMTLHDISLAFTKKKKWRFNLITKFNTSIFTVFDNNYFKDLTGNGRNLSFLSPFSLVLSPGIQYQPIEPLKISVSPYSTELYGVSSDKVAARGAYITETDASGNYKQLITKRKALEFNVWFDHRIKEWLEMQYRMSLFSDYQLGFMNNGNAEGLLITRVKILKDVFLSHRFIVQSDLFSNIANPFITQNIQISLSKTF
jgi:hypothetical protein